MTLPDSKLRDGYRVVGPNTADGQTHAWYFPSLEEANTFAQFIAGDSGAEYDVCKYLGSWRAVRPPVEFVPASDA